MISPTKPAEISEGVLSTSDNGGYVALGLAHHNEIRTWWFVEKGAVAKNPGFVDALLEKTHCNSYFRHKQAKKNGDFPRHKLSLEKGRFPYTTLMDL